MFYLSLPTQCYATPFATIHDLFTSLWDDVSKEILDKYSEQFCASRILGLPFDADFNPETLTHSQRKEVIDWYFLECLDCETSYDITRI